ncbi:substrate-binding domain-containing protein [Clostridium lacusfryxellense]|uniref:substrate-binding domain-containing protein n=1 Tax=Clostridium lacusfryxellense TaxID=205328 RepID=UPI001C0D2015|nr:substrate-binding domain-containing protein [Clostridium lacusfryxellense]MBU3112732.1 substrate-binding domain-containing protein [Clostridium lacusfryxellense]
MIKVRGFLIVISLTLAFTIIGCGKKNINEVSKSKIGFSVYDMQYEYFQGMEKGTKQGVLDLGYGYILHDQKSDQMQMVSGAQDLINQDISALIISPNNPEALGPIVEAAHAKKIPVIVDDIGGGNSNYDAIVISDNIGGGKMAGDYAVKNIKKGSHEAAIIKAEPSAIFASRRGEGFKNTVTAAGFKVVIELSGHSKQEEGYSIMKDIITSNPKIQVVFCENDPMAVGAAQACIDSKRKDIMIIGFNGDKIALDAIKNGIMAATIKQSPGEMGKATVGLADKLIKGKKIDFDDEKNKEIYISVKLITKEDIK